MRKEVDTTIDAFPAQVASFDQAGIQTGVNSLSAAGLLPTFVGLLKSDAQSAQAAITRVWMIPNTLAGAINDVAKVADAASQSFGSLPANATPTQVVNAVITFWKKLLG